MFPRPGTGSQSGTRGTLLLWLDFPGILTTVPFFFADMPALPRPNLGPEPWPVSPVTPVWLALFVVGGMSLVLVLTRLAWRRRRGKAPSGTPRDVTGEAVIPEAATFADLVERTRAALAAQFGPGWLARTTEEIAASVELIDHLGIARHTELVRFLHASDLAQFGGRPLAPGPWVVWVTQFVTKPVCEDEET